MQIIFGDKRCSTENDHRAIDIVLEKVNEAIQLKDTVFSHLIIDDVDVYENHELYIKENLTDILEIKIVTRHTKEMVWETMQSIDEYLGRALPALQEMINSSYNSFFSDSWAGLNQLAEGMQWILQFADFTKATEGKPTNWSQIEQCIKTCEDGFKQLLEGIELQDTVLILDVLSYEIVPSYEKLKDNIKKSLENEEFLRNAH